MSPGFLYVTHRVKTSSPKKLYALMKFFARDSSQIRTLSHILVLDFVADNTRFVLEIYTLDRFLTFNTCFQEWTSHCHLPHSPMMDVFLLPFSEHV